jgi:hypothetical protein
MSEQKEQELWDKANDPQEMVFQYWGELHLRPWECVLVKKVGKVPYDPVVHKGQRTSIAVEMNIIPIPENAVSFPIEREPVDFSKEYKMFLQSVWDAGVDHVARANSQWVRASYKETGETYKKDGEIKQKTYLHIEQFFESEEQCRENFFEITGKDPDADEVPFIPADQTVTAVDATADPQANYEGMKEFLRMAVQEAVEANDNKPITFKQLLPWFDTPKYEALKEIYGNEEAKPFVDKIIAEVMPF